MKTDKHKTDVKFLVNETDKDFDKDVFAFFPKEKYKGTHERYIIRMSYSHIGQHSDCHIDYANESRPATKEEREDLIKELESIGYNLNTIN